jgi:hypothetical protein
MSKASTKIKPAWPLPPASPFGKAKMPNPRETKPARPLSLLAVVIPARDEEGCIASTIEHLHLELQNTLKFL